MVSKSFFFSLFLLIISSVSFSQSTETYQETLKKMFQVSGAEDTYATVIGSILDIFRAQHTEVSPNVWDELESELNRSAIDDLAEMLVPVYSKYISEKDLQEVIAFYETPVGKKYAQYNPVITQESMQIGEKWGAQLAEDIVKRIEASSE